MPKLIDISMKLVESFSMPQPTGVKNVQLSFDLIKDYPGGAGQQVRAVQMRLHHGTHVDAPMHFHKGAASLADLPLDTFYGDITLVDLSGIGRNAAIRKHDLASAIGGRDIRGGRVLIRTNWNRRYGEPDYDANSPYISVEAVDWLAARGPALVGYDYAHAKDGPDVPTPTYAVRTFLAHRIVTLGYLRNLDQIDSHAPATLVAFPLAFGEVEASPVRAVVIQE